ncbi:hypothetical protein [Streptomyces sp. NPDC002540]
MYDDITMASTWATVGDSAWAALTTPLARAETAAHNPRRLLATIGAQR